MSGQDFRQPAVCRLTVDGQEIADLARYLVEARVETGRKEAAVCVLTFDAVRREDGSWLIQDAGVFLPWKRFRIDADFGTYTEEVMRGFVREVKADTPEQMGEAKVTVVCQDESLLLDRQHIRKQWSTEDEPKSDGDIVREIASGEFGFNVEADAGLSNAGLSQDGTYIQLLRDRAEANGYEFHVRAGTLYFQKPQLQADPQPALMIYAGNKTNCLKFTVSHDGHKPDEVGFVRAAGTGTGVEQQSFKPDMATLGKQAATSEGMGLAPFAWQMPRPSGSTLEEAKARAQAKANENAWKVVGDGELDGSLYGHVLLTHRPVGIYGVGETYGGLYYVDQVTHVFNATGYRQAFKLLRNATGRNSEPESADRLAMVR
ncbi:MAG TPA: hypothetical protein VNI58_06020 [Mariprofundaceae bacterium]|nr:hypothetical protein [Mariprofundaceae bacterium]